MGIVSIEKKTFEMMLASFNALSEKVAALRRKSDGGRLERWLTGEEVCGQLRISPRTLQSLRDRRLIGYSQMNRRFYYRPEGGQAAYSAYRHDLSRWKMTLFLLTT